MTNEQIYDDNLQFVDIAHWQFPYKNDGIDEGLRIDGVVIKSADGNRDFTKPGSWEYVEYWKAQWDSIKHFTRKWMYAWYQTERTPKEQSDLAVSICDKFKGLIDAWVIDFEYYMNTINSTTIRELANYVDWFRLNSDVKLIIYVNYTGYTAIIAVLGQEWADDQEWWFAGGKHYNSNLGFFPQREYFENLFDYPGRVAVQWSADGNQLADEHDFGDSELSSIDMNYLYFTPEEYDTWLGRTHIPDYSDPISEGEEIVIVESDNGDGGNMTADGDLIERIMNDPRTAFNVNLNINMFGSTNIVATPVEGETSVENPEAKPSDFPNTILVTVQHPSKAHGLLTTWRNKNVKGYPLFTAFPTDNDDHQSLRIKIPNDTIILVDKDPVRGDGDNHYAFKIVDWDGYFAGLGAVDHKGEPLDVNKLYMRVEWTS